MEGQWCPPKYASKKEVSVSVRAGLTEGESVLLQRPLADADPVRGAHLHVSRTEAVGTQTARAPLADLGEPKDSTLAPLVKSVFDYNSNNLYVLPFITYSIFTVFVLFHL